MWPLSARSPVTETLWTSGGESALGGHAIGYRGDGPLKLVASRTDALV